MVFLNIESGAEISIGIYVKRITKFSLKVLSTTTVTKTGTNFSTKFSTDTKNTRTRPNTR